MSPESTDWSFETRQIHAGQTPDPTTKARALPIFQTTSYAFDSLAHGRRLFALEELGQYLHPDHEPDPGRGGERINALEGGVGALLVASGQAAETLTILTIAEAGDHIVSSPALYGGTYNLFHYTLPKLGIEGRLCGGPGDPASWTGRVKPNTKAFFAEIDLQPAARRARLRGARRCRARARRPADRRQHRADALSHPADRARRRHRGALADQVPRRPWHCDRRRHRRLRQFRLGREWQNFPNFNTRTRATTI